MALVVRDRVKETTTTTGTGTITLLGAVSGYQAFSVIGNTNTTYYAIVDSAAGTWEVGIGTYSTTGPTLSRDTILESSSGGTAISFAAGTKDVFCTYPAERSMYVDGTTITPATAATLPVVSGGTGAATLTVNNVLLGNGTSALQVVAPGTTGNVLTSNGTTWTSAAAGASLLGDTDSATPFETSLGYQAGNVNTGINNTFVGYQSGLANTTGTENTALGKGALQRNTTGASHTAVGTEALFFNTTGQTNVAIGNYALYTNTTASNNVAIGYSAMQNNSTGANNTATGFEALLSNTTAAGNTAHGYQALRSNTTGTQNVGVGFDALYSNTTGLQNTALGYRAGRSGTNNLTTGTNNILIGYNAEATSATVSNENTFGNSSSTSNRFWGDIKPGGSNAGTSGQVLTSAGAGVSPTWTTVGGGSAATPTALGTVYAQTTNATLANTALGFQANNALTTGTRNIAIGYNANLLATTTSSNIAIGAEALSSSITGGGGIAIGDSALKAMTTGFAIAIGGNAMKLATGGNANIAIGNTAMSLGIVTGNGNQCVGQDSLNFLTSGSGNNAFGGEALRGVTTGSNNVAVGNSALRSVSGSTNTALGYQAGQSGTNNLTTGTNNILIGANAAASASAVSNETTIGNSSTTSARIFGKLALQNGSFAGISSTVASAATITPTSDTTNQYTVTALATAATIAIPTGTPADGQRLTIRFKDDGTARALTWTTSAGGYRVIGTTLPTTTVLSKVLYVGCIYNSQDSFWDVVSTAQQA